MLFKTEHEKRMILLNKLKELKQKRELNKLQALLYLYDKIYLLTFNYMIDKQSLLNDINAYSLDEIEEKCKRIEEV